MLIVVINHTIVFSSEFASYRIYYLDQAFVPLYPLRISCSSSSASFGFRDCDGSYHTEEYTETNLYEVGLECKTGRGLLQPISKTICGFTGATLYSMS